MRKLILYILFSVVSFTSFAQYSFQKEKDKYWIYRERLKNFMVSGNGTVCSGCDIPAIGRSLKYTLINGQEVPPSISWADSPWMIGYWVGTLAMEYQLLKDAGLSSTSPEVMKTKEDLYGAIQSINRLDWEAEESWETEFPGCSHCGASNNPCPENINGFLIRDDVPTDLSQMQSIIDGLNEGLVPPPDGYRDKCISSAYTEYLIPGSEASKDHLIGLFIGLSLVKKCISDVNESWNNTQFINGLSEPPCSSFVKEVQVISNRIVQYMANAAPEWTYINPCANRCVVGVHNSHNPNVCAPPPFPPEDCSFTGVPQCCEVGGALAQTEAIGFAAANQFIQGNAPDPVLNYLISKPAYVFAWNQALNNGSRLPITLAALGNIWKLGVCLVPVEITVPYDICAVQFGCVTPPPFSATCCQSTTITTYVLANCSSTTGGVSDHLVNAGKNNNWEHLYLLHKLLYNAGSTEISNAFYECLLNAAPCRGYDGAISIPNAEWSNLDRLAGDRNGNFSSAFSRIDYMFYFNLYNLNEPEAGSPYASIPAKQLAPSYLLKDNYTEYDKKNFMAANTITANTYAITSDPIEGQGRVTFSAGQKITLGDGFKVTNGGYFHGYIDPTIGAMNCSDPPTETNCSELLQKVGHTDPDTITDTDSVIVMPNPPSDSTILRTINKQQITEQKSAPADYNISIIPNPSKGILTLISKDALEYIEVRDMLGNIIFTKVVYNSPVNMDVDIASHPPGIYFLKAQSKGKVYTEKVVVQ